MKGIDFMSEQIFFDGNSTTPLDKRAFDAMLPYFSEVYGNPASIDYRIGLEANNAVTRARKKIAACINADPEDIFFTSGATESDNLAILGILQANADKGKHFITCVTEHSAVLETAKELEKRGYDITYLTVDRSGAVDLDQLKESIRPDTVLVSVMAANNEVGTTVPLKKIGEITRSRGTYFHTDAAQIAGHLPLDVKEMNIDGLSISGHKMHGPKGIGALYISQTEPRVKINPISFGGGHEKGLRSGTLNVPGIVGLAEALEISCKEMQKEYDRFVNWRQSLLSKLQQDCGNVELNGHPDSRIPHNISLYIKGVENKDLLNRLPEFALSAGSACTTMKDQGSHVIEALNLGDRRAYNTIRIGFCRMNTQEQFELLSSRLAEEITAIRRISG